MRVRADYSAYPAVEVVAHRDLFAGGLRVHIHDDDWAISQSRQGLVDPPERTVQLSPHERASHQIDHGQAVVPVHTAPWGAFWVVQRPHYRRVAVQDGIDLAFLPDVVAGRHDIDAGLEQLVRRPQREAPPARGVLHVRDDEIDASSAAYLRQQRGDGAPAQLADNVADYEDLQGSLPPCTQRARSPTLRILSIGVRV